MPLTIDRLYLGISDKNDDRIGNIRLRQYQSELRNCEDRVVLLRAPTASGKTLAYLIRAVESGGREPRFGSTIIVYPTNALIWDQAVALNDLLTTKLGKKTNMVVDSDDIKWEIRDPNADIDLFVINGESLGALAEERKSSEGSALIGALSKSQRPWILLTNPEILYYIFLYKFARGEEIFKLLFHAREKSLIIFDEFHLYHGYSLATITYMLGYIKNLFDQIVFSSATPINISRIIDEPFKEIRAEPSETGDIVRHQIFMDLDETPRIIGTEKFPSLIKLVEHYYEICREKKQQVKVLLILNSVITCVKMVHELENRYPGQITAIHGLVPQKSRPRKQSDFHQIVVGTSAIEVGMDFDTSSLIFEAHDSSSFIQRLGRGARHDVCICTAFIPSLYSASLRKRLSGVDHFHPLEFNSIVTATLPRLQSYENFAGSKQALPILFSILLNWVFARSAGRRKLNDGQAVKELEQLLVDHSIELPGGFEQSRTSLIEMCRSRIGHTTLTLAKKMSCRSSMDSIPVMFPTSQGSQFDMISLTELPKLDFELIRKEQIVNQGIKIPWKMRLQEDFLSIAGIRDTPEKVRIKVHNPKDEFPYPLTMFLLECADADLQQKLHAVLLGQPYYPIFGREDWRLAGFFNSDGQYFVVGGDAYLAWYIKESAGVTLC
jgi:CRISPR-associated helicase Cas3